jgi:Flp pilus assembly protein CpaB
MISKLTLITSIVLTAAMTAAGTYYVTNNTQPSENRSAEAANQPADLTPVAVAVNQQPNKPVEIIIKTEIVEKHGKTGNVGSTRNLTQPQLHIYKD